VNKECPYCKVDDFGLWDLFKLTFNYSTPSECRNCGGLVRNSGWSQFLTLLTTVLFFVVGLLFIAPLIPEWVFVLALIALLPLPTMLFAKPVIAEIPPANLPPFIPDPNNDKAIMVSGWEAEELDKALDDFVARGTSGRPQQIAMYEYSENLYRLTFPEDIPVGNFVALINYLNYPIDFGGPERKISVAGNTSLNSEFAGIPESLWEKRAILYVPEDDEDFDLVYLLAGTGDTFAFAFNQKGYWRRMNDPRLPEHVNALTLSG
jgi:hypothetical protein